jgi:hypothetical protein
MIAEATRWRPTPDSAQIARRLIPAPCKRMIVGSLEGFASPIGSDDTDRNALKKSVDELSFLVYIFGGFTGIGWDSSRSHKCDNFRDSFLFSVTNPRNTETKCFPLENSSYAIYCNPSHVSTFGDYDLYVADCCNENTSSYTSLGAAYQNDTGLSGAPIEVGLFIEIETADNFGFRFKYSK